MFYFTPLRGFFSPFPHGTSSLSVTTAYLALEDGPPSFRQGFSCPALLTNNRTSPKEFVYATITRSGAAFQPASTFNWIFYSSPTIQRRNDCRTTPTHA